MVKWTYNKSWAWEDADGLLFQVSGLRCEKSELMAAAESIQRCSRTPKTLKLGWKPDNTSLFMSYAAADTVEELWSRNNIAITFTYSVSPIAAPAGTARSVSVNGAKASFYPAQEAYRGSSGTTTVNGEPVTESSKLESQYESVLLAMSGGNVEYLENGETVYTIRYSTGATETATRTILDDGSIAYVCEDGNRRSIVSLTDDGKILLNGHEVKHTVTNLYTSENVDLLQAELHPARVGRMEVFHTTPVSGVIFNEKPMVTNYHLVEFSDDDLTNLTLTVAISVCILAFNPTVVLDFDFFSNCMTVLTSILVKLPSQHALGKAVDFGATISKYTTPRITDPYNQYFKYVFSYRDPTVTSTRELPEVIYSTLTQGL